jgi:hypothetical protein
MVETNANTLVAPADPAQAGDTVAIYYDALGAVNPLAAIGIAVPLDGGVVEHGEASRSDHGHSTSGSDAGQTGPRDHSPQLTGDAAPVLIVAEQTSPGVTIAVR